MPRARLGLRARGPLLAAAPRAARARAAHRVDRVLRGLRAGAGGRRPGDARGGALPGPLRVRFAPRHGAPGLPRRRGRRGSRARARRRLGQGSGLLCHGPHLRRRLLLHALRHADDGGQGHGDHGRRGVGGSAPVRRRLDPAAHLLPLQIRAAGHSGPNCARRRSVPGAAAQVPRAAARRALGPRARARKAAGAHRDLARGGARRDGAPGRGARREGGRRPRAGGRGRARPRRLEPRAPRVEPPVGPGAPRARRGLPILEPTPVEPELHRSRGPLPRAQHRAPADRRRRARERAPVPLHPHRAGDVRPLRAGPRESPLLGLHLGDPGRRPLAAQGHPRRAEGASQGLPQGRESLGAARGGTKGGRRRRGRGREARR
mmetsp:Transcript_20263/g.66263  ORF Transcript_20263/g.66263 Transcript_20263/m.66263 type:complete len:376 (+) Transcript_20263:704-1831(+)